jgi:serine protease Do
MMMRRIGAVGLLGMTALVGACGGQPAEAAQSPPLPAAEVAPGMLSNAPVLPNTPPDFRTAAAQALPAVVRIDVVQTRAAAQRQMPEFDLPMPFGREFRMPQMPESQPRAGTGSGVIFDARGLVMTNRHVVDGADRVRVRLSDGREFAAEVLGADPATDVAVVRLDAPEGTKFSAAALGDVDDIQVGDWVLALGSPMGLDFSVTAGIVSAKGRSIGILNGESEAPLESFIQTDAAINPGNSGGPLIDMNGRVVGINTAIQSPTGTFAGYGFAVPVDVARKVAADLVEHGAVQRPRLGVQIADATSADARVFGLDAVRGAVVRSVQDGTPAARAGLRMGDVIVGLEGREVATANALTARLAEHQPGDRVRLDVVRYGDREQFDVELERFDTAVAAKGEHTAERAAPTSSFGFDVQPLTPALAQRMQLSAADGLVITSVDPLSAAAAAGVRAGQVVQRVNGTEIRGVADLEKVARGIDAGDVVSMVVRQGDADVILNFTTRG